MPHKRRCPHCIGEGIIRFKTPGTEPTPEICPTCNGTGWQRKKPHKPTGEN